jgi:Ca2+/Na+ antiporter
LHLFVFPLDVVFLSRAFVSGSSNPALYAALLGAVHFLLFVMLIRLYSATTDRDALFLTMLSFAAILASAVLTIDTTFLGLFFLFLLFGVATFVGLEMRRGSNGAIASQADVQPQQERRLTWALVLAALSVALGAMIFGGRCFFFPRFSAGYLGCTSLQPALMSGFT